MSYSTTSYRRGYRPGTTLRTGTPGRVVRPNKRAGDCRECGETIPAGAGNLWRETDGTWSVVHVQESQGGWLMHPGPVRGGCPGDTDARNAELLASGFFGPGVTRVASERAHIDGMAARFAATAPDTAPVPRKSYAYTSSGARMSNRRGRCEDAPCCGCCD